MPAASAMAATCPGGSPASCSGRSSTSLHPLVAASRLSPNFTPSDVSSPFRALSRSFRRRVELAPRSGRRPSRSAPAAPSGRARARAPRAPSQSSVHPPEEPVVEHGVVAVAGEARRHLPLDGLDLRRWSAAATSVPKTACTRGQPLARHRPAPPPCSRRWGRPGWPRWPPPRPGAAAMAASKAGRKCSGRISPKGGSPKGAVHSARSGFAAGASGSGCGGEREGEEGGGHLDLRMRCVVSAGRRAPRVDVTLDLRGDSRRERPDGLHLAPGGGEVAELGQGRAPAGRGPAADRG